MLLALLLALSAFLFVGACSFSQVSDEDNALDVIRSSVAATTEIDLLIAVELDDIRAAGESSETDEITVEGFPFQASLTPEEARELEPVEIRELLLDQAAVDVYANGLSAFDETGSQDVDSLSSQGMLNRILGTLTESNHDRSSQAATLFLVISLILGAVLVALRKGPARFSLLGGTLALAGVLGLIATGLVYLTVRVLASGSDPFVGELRNLVEMVVEVAVRNYAVFAFLGGAIWALAAILRVIDRRPPAASHEAWDVDGAEYWYDDEDQSVMEGRGRGRA